MIRSLVGELEHRELFDLLMPPNSLLFPMGHHNINMRIAILSFALSLTTSVIAQYFPADPQNVTVVKSQIQDGVYISYKEVCEARVSLISSVKPL